MDNLRFPTENQPLVQQNNIETSEILDNNSTDKDQLNSEALKEAPLNYTQSPNKKNQSQIMHGSMFEEKTFFKSTTSPSKKIQFHSNFLKKNTLDDNVSPKDMLKNIDFKDKYNVYNNNISGRKHSADIKEAITKLWKSENRQIKRNSSALENIFIKCSPMTKIKSRVFDFGVPSSQDLYSKCKQINYFILQIFINFI